MNPEIENDVPLEIENRLNALWDARFAELNAYRRAVHAAAQRHAQDRPLVWVRCRTCPRSPVVGRVVGSELGPLLVTRQPPVVYDGGRTLPLSEVRAMKGVRDPAGPALAWVLAGPNAYPARFGWRPPDVDDEPHVLCPRHGRLDVDAPALLACRMDQRRPSAHSVGAARPS